MNFANERLSPRLSKMREFTIKAPQEVSLVRAREFTRTAKNNPDLPKILQFAYGFQNGNRALPITIHDDERIVGQHTEKVKGAMLYPEIKSDFLLKEVDNFGERESDRFMLSPAEKKELREEILPYWRDNSAYDHAMKEFNEELEYATRNLLFAVGLDYGGSNQLAHVNYQKVLQTGLLNIIKSVEDKLNNISADAPDATEKIKFYKALHISGRSIIEFANRYSQLALGQAKNSLQERAQELYRISEITSHVPAYPARNFYEAIQSYWFTFLAITSLDGDSEPPLGRIDQFLYPYYEKDVENGTLTREEAYELIAELFIKLNQFTALNEYVTLKVLDGNNQRLTFTIGGVDSSGNDAANEVSHIILDVLHDLMLTKPNPAIRLHNKTQEKFRCKVIEMMTEGSNLVEVFNDEVIIPGLIQSGFSQVDANDYIITGCVEPVAGGTYGPACSGIINTPKVLEFYLNKGEPIISMAGDEADNLPPEIHSMDEFWISFEEWLESVVKLTTDALYSTQKSQKELLPNPVISLLMDGCIESGKDVKSAGSRNNITGVNILGLGTLTDSIAALKELIFEQKKYTLPEVMEWVKSDFDGYENERRMLRNHMPKFGNDEPKADEIASRVVDKIYESLKKYKTYRGGIYALGLHSETHHIIQGIMVAASLDGRNAGEMLSPGCGPTSGMDQKGPTATMLSLSKIDYKKVTSGSSANMRFHPDLFKDENRMKQFDTLLRTYFKQGGQHLQINVVDSKILRDAQENPENYQNLIVRITGYSARFVDLSLATQEEIIKRSEMHVCS